MKQLFFLTVILAMSSSCQKYYVSVMDHKVSRSSLASTFAKTPDPRQYAPPKGEHLLIEWNLKEEVEEELICNLSILFKNFEQKVSQYKISTRQDALSYFLLGEEFEKTKGILSYKVEILNQEGQILQFFVHKLWTELITIDDE